jgi:hypothetical protein
MTTQLVEIQPLELKFIFEVKKQSSCMIRLVNLSDQYVAFKVKTTSPKKYCVRPNTGVIKPISATEFTVTMQAQRLAPPDMLCKDKFLIQSTIVPFGTTEDGLASNVFAKDSGAYIEEYKLRVVLVSPPNSPVLLPVNNGASKQEPSYEPSTEKDKFHRGVENLPPLHPQENDIDDVDNLPDIEEEPRAAKDKDFNYAPKESESFTAKVVDFNHAPKESASTAANEMKYVAEKVVEDKKSSSPVHLEVAGTKAVDSTTPDDNVDDEGKTKSKLREEIEEIKSKLSFLDSKLHQAEATISKLKEDRSITIQEKETLIQELEMLKRNSGVRRVQHRGFPLLFVCMVAMISVVLGYRLHT